MADKKIKLTKRDRFNVMWHSQFLQGSWNYERMQNGGYAYSMIPALRKLYPDKKDLSAALQRHLVINAKIVNGIANLNAVEEKRNNRY